METIVVVELKSIDILVKYVTFDTKSWNFVNKVAGCVILTMHSLK